MPWQFNNGRAGGRLGRGTGTRLLIHLWCVSQSLDGVFAVPYSFWMTKWAECGLQMHGSIMLHMWTHLSGTKSEKKSWKRWAFLFETVPWFNTETHNYIEHNYIELIQGFVVVSIDYIIGLAHSPLPPDSKHTTNQSCKFPRKLQRWPNLQQRDVYSFELEFKTL